MHSATLKNVSIVLVSLVCMAGCGAAITKIKYIQHHSSTQLRLADNSVITASQGKHFMLYLVNCIDNATRDDAFFFFANKILSDENQYALVDGSHVPHIAKLVSAHGIEPDIGQVVLELSGPPADVFENLYYDSSGSESVLMINQTPLGEQFGPAFFIVETINLSTETSSPFINDPCVNSGAYPQ